MARPRSAKNALPKLLENTPSIVYMVQGDGTILFANHSVADWVGVDDEKLVGFRLVYSSAQLQNELDNRLAGLCPPPGLLQPVDGAQEAETDFLISTHRDNVTYWRTATAIRLLDPHQPEPLILVIGASNNRLVPPEIDSPQAQPNQLHSALAAIRQQSNLAYHLDTLVGTSAFAARLRRQVKFATECHADLLVVGPTGSGKEHIARTIHAARAAALNSQGLLTPIDCRIADQQLIHAAISQTKGHNKPKFSSSVGGPAKSLGGPAKSLRTDSLLLLNVDQLNPIAQTELLGFLQLPDFGLRLIATSSRPLSELTPDRCMEELAAHLGALTIEVLPLNRRTEDLPMLAQSLLERGNHGRKIQCGGFDKVVTQLLLEFLWPGNLDQLAGVIHEASQNANGSLIVADDLPKKFHDSIKAQRIGGAIETEIDLEQYLQEIEKELLVRAMQQARGNKAKAAKLLGISRAKLIRRIQFFELAFEFDLDSGKTSPDVLESSAFEEID